MVLEFVIIYGCNNAERNKMLQDSILLLYKNKFVPSLAPTTTTTNYVVLIFDSIATLEIVASNGFFNNF